MSGKQGDGGIKVGLLGTEGLVDRGARRGRGKGDQEKLAAANIHTTGVYGQGVCKCVCV